MENLKMFESGLAVGNLVLDIYDNIHTIIATDLVGISKGDVSFKPLSINKDILFKFGFECGIHDDDMRISINNDVSMSVWLNTDFNNVLIGDDLVITILYVHELQNLLKLLKQVTLTL